MTTWTTNDRRLLEAAQIVLRLYGIELSWLVGSQGITAFEIKRHPGAWITYEVAEPPFHREKAERLLAEIVSWTMEGRYE